MTIIEFASVQRKLNLSDAELGALLDVDRATVWRWRTGAAKIERITELAMRYICAKKQRKRKDNTNESLS